MKPELLVAINLDPVRSARLQERYTIHPVTDPATLAATLAAAGDRIRGAVTSGSAGFKAETIAALPALELICAIGAGFENIDLAAARARGITVTHGPGANAASVADHAIALLCSIVRDIPGANRAVHDGEWARAKANRERPGLSGKRLGVLGLGQIGFRIAQIGRAGFGMEVAYHTRNPVVDAPYRYVGDLVQLAQGSDFLIVATPGGPSTRHLVDAVVLAALGPEGFLVNIARGTVVDTAVLISALREERIRGAALDVIEGEPEVPSALLALPNAIVTPHMAGSSPEARAKMTELLLQNLNAHFAGQPVLTPVPGS